MDNESIKTYTDKKAFEKIFNNIFSKYQSFFKTKESGILVKFISYIEDKVAFKINVNIVEKNCLIFSRDDSNNSIFAYLELIEEQKDNTYLFMPLKIQIIPEPREEERKILDPQKNSNHRIFIINMISEFIIRKSLEFYKKKIDHIEEIIKTKLDKYFQRIRIYFIHYGKESRMNYFKENIKPIFIQNINQEPDERNKEIFNFFLNEIYPNDPHLIGNKKIISEISVPIVFNMKIPYGFVQVNSSGSFTESSLQIVKKMAIIINELLKKNKIFPQAEEKISVFDISKTGIGVIFKDKKCVKYFSENQLVYFDLLLPDHKKVNILSSVRHISIKGSIYKVGCKIIEIDALSEVYYDEYLESIGIK